MSMSQKQALEILSQEEAVAKLIARGYTKSECPSCHGLGMHVVEAPGMFEGMAKAQAKIMCAKCDGKRVVWTAPVSG